MALQIFMAKRGDIKVVDGKVKTTLRIAEAMFWDLKAARTALRLPSDEAVLAAVIEEGLASWEATGALRPSAASGSSPSPTTGSTPVSQNPVLIGPPVNLQSEFEQVNRKLDELLKRGDDLHNSAGKANPQKPVGGISATKAGLRGLAKDIDKVKRRNRSFGEPLREEATGDHDDDEGRRRS